MINLHFHERLVLAINQAEEKTTAIVGDQLRHGDAPMPPSSWEMKCGRAPTDIIQLARAEFEPTLGKLTRDDVRELVKDRDGWRMLYAMGEID